MKRQLSNRAGFTLIEVIISIVVITIIAAIAGFGFIEITNGYLFAKKNASTAQQAQIAMMRIKKELSNINSVSSGQPTSIAYTRVLGGSHTISWAGGNSPVLIDNTDTLIQPVTLFGFVYYNDYLTAAPYTGANTSIIEITLQVQGAGGATITFKDRVNLNLELNL